MEQSIAEKEKAAELPIINCHTHIFIGDHVPPWLARTYLWWPFYYLLHLPFIVIVIAKVKKLVDGFYFWEPARISRKILLAIRFFFYRLGIVFTLLSIWVTLQVFFFLYHILVRIITPNSKAGIEWIQTAEDFLRRYHLLINPASVIANLLLVLFLLTFVQWGRNLIYFIFKKIWNFFGMLPGPQTLDLFKRYLNIGWFSSYKSQAKVLEKLSGQYPKGTGFIILPMDMWYMGAGKPKASLEKQMQELKSIHDRRPNEVFPFVPIDPRRMAAEGASFFAYEQDETGYVELKEGCFVRKYIEDEGFSGFKIYPALGYYPFEEELLALWFYAQQHDIPITTHCIRGTIFYRGTKISEWNRHPVFKQIVREEWEPMLLPELANVDFSTNFTHPLNYLCLLDERLLRILVGRGSEATKKLFGYQDENTEMLRNLSQLKICFAHYGGDDEWEKFLETERNNYGAQLMRHPGTGITFLHHESEGNSIVDQGLPEQLWHNDWYSIITSLILQYDNVYSDISYIVHNNSIFPLLKASLAPENLKLRKRILFGTDFYVVRNHKSERHMLIDTSGGLTKEEFDQIARINPQSFLKTNF